MLATFYNSPGFAVQKLQKAKTMLEKVHVLNQGTLQKREPCEQLDK